MKGIARDGFLNSLEMESAGEVSAISIISLNNNEILRHSKIQLFIEYLFYSFLFVFCFLGQSIFL